MANLDLFNLFWKRTEQEQEFRGYASTVRKVRPFSLESELAGVVSQLCSASDKTLRGYLQTARLPYPVMWLEADYATAFAHLKRNQGEWALHEAAPKRVGWLIIEAPEGSGVYSVTRVASLTDPDDGEAKAVIYPLIHLFSPTMRLEAENAFRMMRHEVHPDILDILRGVNSDSIFPRLAWAGDDLIKSNEAKTTDAELADLSRKSPLYQTNVILLEPRMLQLCEKPITPDQSTVKERTANLIDAAGADQIGELAFVVAALALLNEIPVKFVPYKPSGLLRAAGRLRPYMSSSIVSIEVPATRRRLKDIQKHLAQKGREAIRHARHEVRGHWRHAKTLPRCEDNHGRWERHYDPVTNAPKGWRMWIPNHERGDASLGWVKQSYHVERGRGAIPGLEGERDGVAGH